MTDQVIIDSADEGHHENIDGWTSYDEAIHWGPTVNTWTSSPHVRHGETHVALIQHAGGNLVERRHFAVPDELVAVCIYLPATLGLRPWQLKGLSIRQIGATPVQLQAPA